MTQLSQERTAAAAAGEPTGGWLPPPLKPPAQSRRLLAAVALLALLAGVPAVLAAVVGWPLPGSLPTLSEGTAVLSSPLAASLIVDVLAFVTWVAWAHFTVCVAVELSVAVRGSRSGRMPPAPRVPLGGVSQQLARRLVEAALVTATVATSIGVGSGTILTPARPAVAAQEWRAAVPVAFPAQHDPTGSEAAATVAATAPVPEHEAAPPRPEYTVQPPHGGYYDSLWDIADRFLGDGQRWREIYELNKSRDQPDGRALTRPELIRPGWRLYLPADATGLPAGDAGVERPPDSEPAQDAGPGPAALGASPLPSPPPAEATAPAGTQGIASPSPPTAPPPAAGASTAETADPRPSVLPYAEEPVAADDQDDDDGAPPGSAVGGLLAAAALGSVAMLRHRQRRRRPENGSIPRPEPSVAAAEGQLRVLAEPEDLSFVDEALRALTVALQEDHDLPDVRSATLHPDHLDLRLAQAMPDAPPPFVASDGGVTWRVQTEDRPLVSPAASSEVLPLLPLLLTVGRGAEGPVLLDLEAVGSLALDGSGEDVLGALTHLVAESVLAPWADGVEVLLVGFEPDIARRLELLGPDRVTAVSELDASLLRVLEMRSSRVAAAGDRLRTRIRGSDVDATDEVRPPLLVVHAAQPSPAHAEQLAALVPEVGRVGVAVVALAPWSGARATWTLGEARPLLDAPALTPCRLDPDRLHALADLLRTACEPAKPAPAAGCADSAGPQPGPPVVVTPPAKQPPVRALGAPLARAESATESHAGRARPDQHDEPGDQLDQTIEAYLRGKAPVTVGLLGPITVTATGSIEPDRRARLTEIVAYLATHRAGAQLADFDAAIWPDRPVTLKTRNQAITRTRAWLGADDEGVSWLRPLSDGVLRLSNGVLVDWEIFQALQKRSRRPDRSRTAVQRDLKTALQLVRGRPLSQLPARRYGWLAETYLEQEIPSAVIDAAHSLARILLEEGDADGVVKVARLALDVDRYDERPWRDLLQAHELRGEHRQIALLVEQLQELLDVELDDELQPETAELIERLAPRRRRA